MKNYNGIKASCQQCITAITADSTTLRLRSGQAQANPLGIANVSAKPKIINFNPVTDGYTRPLPHI